MLNRNYEVFILKGEKLNPLPTRTMRDGVFGKTFEDALQTIFEKYPQLIPGNQIEPGAEDLPGAVFRGHP